ncbi:MAG: glycosyltransferase [Bdellovibrionaceae bacterium]|nr:glycosyltransferase [Pseudobdellovibrionaceae bacterium]
MTIAFLLRNAEGGIRTHVLSLIHGLRASGHRVLLITDLSQADNAFHKELAERPEWQDTILDIPIASAPGPTDLIALFRIARGLAHHRPDVIHGHGAKGGLLARMLRLCRLVPKTTKILYTPHGGSLHDMHGRLLNRVYSLVENLLAPATDLVIFESRYTQSQFQAKVRNENVRGLLNRNGVPHLECDLSAWPDGIGTNTPLRIAAFGLLRKIKGFDDLIRAVHQLHAKGWRVTLEIFGEGPERENLERLVTDLGLSEIVTLHGATHAPLDEMRQRHVVIQPSLFESFGLVALEAQALGKAIIASKTGGLIDVVEDNHSGLLVAPGSPEGIVRAVEQLLADPKKTLDMRRTAVERARTHFSLEQMIQKNIQIYSGAWPAK